MFKFCGLDPGISGGISIIDGDKLPKVFKMPVKEVIINKKKKKIYDLQQIVNILKPYVDKNIMFIQETVSSMPGQGVTSAFNFGKSAGSTIGIATALGFNIIEIRASIWKKIYPGLNTDEIQALREEIKKIRIINKTLKEKLAQKNNNKKRNKAKLVENEKKIEKLNRQVKSKSKNAARFLVSQMYPELSELFKKKNTDGMAESLLIALYGVKNLK